MECAVNYSRAAAELVEAGQIRVDLFKCPAWPDLVAVASRLHPTYVHFPLRAGRGGGDVIDTETGQGTDWSLVETLLLQTDTPFVNVHLAPTVDDHPDIPIDTAAPAYVEHLTVCLIR